jgi:transcriptional regulator with XRE-family HTH domain
MQAYTFGHLLKVTRLRYGLDQIEFAKKLDISQSTYSRYEKGKIEPPIGFVMKLTESFEFPFYLLFYPDIDETLSILPLKLFEFLTFENNFDYNPLRVKTKKRKEDDLIDIYSYIGSMIGQTLKKIGSYKLEDFNRLVDLEGYNDERIVRAIALISKAYKL